jgi:anti-anti-sigma factor
VLVVRLAGELDSDNARRADEFMKGAFQTEQPGHVLLDFSGLAYGSSALLGSLLFWKDQVAKRGGALVLFGLQALVADLLRAVGFQVLFTLAADQETALTALPALPGAI